jgi:hypothetical protein
MMSAFRTMIVHLSALRTKAHFTRSSNQLSRPLFACETSQITTSALLKAAPWPYSTMLYLFIESGVPAWSESANMRLPNRPWVANGAGIMVKGATLRDNLIVAVEGSPDVILAAKVWVW